jgi:hypothetical protein
MSSNAVNLEAMYMSKVSTGRKLPLALLIVVAVALHGLAQTGQAEAKSPPFAKNAKDGAPNDLSAFARAKATDTASSVPSIAEKTKDATKLAGYFNLYWDARTGKLWLEIDKWNTEFLYQTSLPAGVGSNDIGLDRGQMGETRIVRFERTGPKILLIQANLDYRAVTSDPDERTAVRQSFAESALWGFTAAAEEGNGDNAKVLVDATEFFLRDTHHVPEVLARAKQGAFKLDDKRCAFYLARTKNFPLNTEVEATLTFEGDHPGQWVKDVTPSPDSITVREHHSFVQLPPPGYKTRVYDPRSSFFGISYQDYATPISEPIVKRFTARHRLQKKDPSAAVSEAVAPIIYYLDRGTPEPIRSALLEGANWWQQAFEAAGYRNAFRVEMMPEGADPMDLRYNVIQWVHRATRGWSYGEGVIDPRTGEIIKGQVSLGSLRVRQDFLIAEGLLAPYEAGKPASTQQPNKMQEMALARLRQLAAHEVGHTLGLEHNYSASTVGRSSVMDYPPPLVMLGADGAPDLSQAYATGIGEWDKVSITWGYADFSPGADEHVALDKILSDAYSGKHLRFLTDQDARSAGSSSSVAHLWDSGANAVDELDRLMKVREAALKRFGESNIREGAPLATLEDALVPIYMLHRYQVEAASKLIGGMDYTFAVRGDGEIPTAIVAADEQRRALKAVLATLDPRVLAIPESLLKLIPPRPVMYPRGREDFRIHTSPAFDAVAPAEAAAQHVMQFLFNPQRAARLVEFHDRDAANPPLNEVIDQILADTHRWANSPGYLGEIGRAADNTAVYDLMALANDSTTLPEVRAIATAELHLYKQKNAITLRSADDPAAVYFSYVAQQIEQFEKDPTKVVAAAPYEPPDGPPIGDDEDF